MAKDAKKRKTSKPVKPANPAGLLSYLAYGVVNWYLFFEIREAKWRNKGGLDFVKFFTAAKSTASTQFRQLLAVLQAISPERYYANVGIFFALVTLTATLQRCYRGWLLDEALQPLTEKGLALRLFIDLPTMRRALKDLLASGLIRQEALPQFDPEADDDDEQASTGRRNRRGRARGTSRKPRENKGRNRPCANLRKSAQKCGSLQEHEPEVANGNFNEKNLTGQMAKGNAKAKGQEERPRQQPPAAPPTTPPEEGQGPGPQGPPEVTRQADRHYSPPGHREPATLPARVPSGPKVIPLHRDGDARPLADLLPRALDGLAHGQAVRADDFAREIFHLLGPPFDAASRDGARELGCYRAGWLDAIDAGLSPPQMEDLWTKARKDAATIGQHRRRFYANGGSPEQYWRFRFNKHLNSRRGLPATPAVKAGAG